MSTVIKFVKDTIAGGLFLLIPLFVLLFIGNKVWQKVSGIGHRFSDLLGIHSLIGLEIAPILTSLVILLFCFFSGLLLRLRFMNRIRKLIDRILVKYIPGYALFKITLEEKIGREDVADARQAVLMTIDGIGQAGVIIEEIPDGRKVVFIPAKPGTPEGQVFVVSNDVLQHLSTKESTLNEILEHQGKGLAVLVAEPG